MINNNKDELVSELKSYKKFINDNLNFEKANMKLNEVYVTRDKKKAFKLVQKAFKISNKCFGAIILQFDLEDNFLKKEKI